MCVLCRLADVATILGGIGTVGTFIRLICDSRKKSKQIETIQNIESRQLDALYTPDIRIDSYGIGNFGGTYIGVLNNGENVIIKSIEDFGINEFIINKEGMKNWFPLNFDKAQTIKIPLLKPLNQLPSSCEIKIVVINRMQQKYICYININASVVKIRQIIKAE